MKKLKYFFVLEINPFDASSKALRSLQPVSENKKGPKIGFLVKVDLGNLVNFLPAHALSGFEILNEAHMLNNF